MPLKLAIGTAPSFMEAAFLSCAFAGTVSIVEFYELSWHFVKKGSQTKQLYKTWKVILCIFLHMFRGKKILLSVKMGYFQWIFL